VNSVREQCAKDMNSPGGRLALKAVCSNGGLLISSLLQDSIFHLSTYSFHQSQGRLRLLLNRFCWESADDGNKKFFRVHSGLYVYNVKSVAVSENLRNKRGNYLNLLAVQVPSADRIELTFSEHASILLDVNCICIYLRDLHDKHPTPSCPAHEL
jgi:hypothetical protein